jgi:hypothetical protein
MSVDDSGGPRFQAVAISCPFVGGNARCGLGRQALAHNCGAKDGKVGAGEGNRTLVRSLEECREALADQSALTLSADVKQPV